MSHRKTRTTMVVLAIVITVVLLVGIPVSFPGLTGTPVAVVIWVITAILLLPIVLLMLCLIVVDMLHGYILKWDDREEAFRQKQADQEHYYAHKRRMRELEEKQFQRKYCYHAHQHQPRRVRLQQRPKDLTDYGC